jgi:hypothetical protein
MNLRPSGPGGPAGRAPGRAGALAATAPMAKRTLAQIRARIASGYYDRDHVRDQVLRCIQAELAGRPPWNALD